MPAQSAPRRLLVPVDFSDPAEAALEYALHIARPGDEVHVLHVVPTVETALTLLAKPPSAAQIELRLRNASEEALSVLIGRMAVPEAVGITSSVAVGDANATIVERAASIPASLVVMSTRGRGAVGRTMLGSVADNVARTAPCPVLLIRADADRSSLSTNPISRVYVPLDGSQRSQQALPIAARFADDYGCPLVVVRVREYDRLDPIYVASLTPQIVDELAESERDAIKHQLEDVVAQMAQPGRNVSWRVLEGPTGPAIAEDLLPTDLVVMCSHGRHGVQRWLLGSVAEYLMRHSPAPLMLVPTGASREEERKQ